MMMCTSMCIYLHHNIRDGSNYKFEQAADAVRNGMSHIETRSVFK